MPTKSAIHWADDLIVSDVSSNTVSLLVTGGKLVGAFDACIFAPGTLHGALDVDAIRKVDAGEWTANEAFQHAGVDFSLPEGERMRAVAMFAAMECAALRLLNRTAEDSSCRESGTGDCCRSESTPWLRCCRI